MSERSIISFPSARQTKPRKLPRAGIHENVPIETYISWPAKSPGLWPASQQSMKKVRYDLDNPPEQSDAMVLGSAIHTSIFEPDDYWDRYVLWPSEKDEKTGYGGTRRGKGWDEFSERYNGTRTILRECDWNLCIAARDAVHTHPAAKKLIKRGSAVESSLVWKDTDTGLWCKSRPDLIGDRIVDVKSTGRIDDWSLRYLAARLGYHVKLAAKHDGLYRLTGERKACVLVFVDRKPPHDVVVRKLLDDVLQDGLGEWRRLLQRIAECESSGNWPDISADELCLTLPPFTPGAGIVEDVTLDGEVIF